MSFKKHLDSMVTLEPFDMFLFRPIAFLVIKLTWFLPLTPNIFSFLALLAAIFAGYSMSSGTSDGFFLGGIGIIIFSVLDCCDGMLARKKGNGTKYGVLVDMFVDLLANISFFLGLFIGLSKSSNFFPIQYLILLSAPSILLHAGVFNFYHKQYKHYKNKDPHGIENEFAFFKAELKSLEENSGNYLNKLMIKLFLVFSNSQGSNQPQKAYDTEHYCSYNRAILPMWSVIAGSTHLTFLATSLMFYRIGIYFFFSIIIFNLWFVLMTIIQTGVNGTLRDERC